MTQEPTTTTKDRRLGAPRKRLGRAARLALAAGAALAVPLVTTAAPAQAGFGFSVFPVAAFSLSSTYVQSGTVVTADARASYGLEGSIIQQYNWDFGDGTTGSGVMVDHPFTTPGFHTVTLTVVDQYATVDTEVSSVYVWDTPKAVMTTSATTGMAPLTVSGDASASQGSATTPGPAWPVTRYVWNWGDTTQDFTPTARHTYTTPGRYSIALVVNNETGRGDFAAATVNVTEPMAPPTDLKAGSTFKQNATLTWHQRMTTVWDVRIQRCPGSRCTSFTEVGFAQPADTSYTEGGLRSGTTYRYRLQIIDIAGNVGYSNIASVKVR